MAKRILLNKDPVPAPRTHAVLDSLTLLGLQDGVPNSINVGIQVGNVSGDTFTAEQLLPKGPINGSLLYDKDPEAFDRVIDAVLEYLTEQGVVDGTKE